MEASQPARLCSRRDFLKTLTGVSAALVIDPRLWFSARPPTPAVPGLPSLARPLKLGVLLPGATLYPNLGSSLTDGMQLYFAQAGGAPVTVIVEKIATPNLALPGASRLLHQDQADLFVGVCNPSVGSRLSGWAQANETIFIAADAGANILREHEFSQNIFYNSLGYWQSNAALGAWAAENLGTRAVIASSLYDSGYDALYAFRLGFEMAGGQILETRVAHVPPDRDALPDLIAAIQHAQPDFVYCLFSGPRAIDFVRAYAESRLSARIPLAASAFTVDESFLPHLGDAARGIKSAFSWSPVLSTLENISFAGAFRQFTGRSPDPFAALGYTTARLIAQALRAVDGDWNQTGRLRDALRSTKFVGPQGTLEIDPTTHSSTLPLYLREVRSRDGVLCNDVVGELAPIPAEDARLVSLRRAVRTGWTHAYLEV